MHSSCLALHHFHSSTGVARPPFFRRHKVLNISFPWHWTHHVVVATSLTLWTRTASSTLCAAAAKKSSVCSIFRLKQKADSVRSQIWCLGTWYIRCQLETRCRNQATVGCLHSSHKYCPHATILQVSQHSSTICPTVRKFIKPMLSLVHKECTFKCTLPHQWTCDGVSRFGGCKL